jgi:hypothetical protein
LKRELFVPELIFLPQLIDVNHHWRHYLCEFRVIRQKRLVLVPELHDSNFFQHDIDDLSIELRVGEVEVEEVIMGLFPALDDYAPDDNQQIYSPFYYKREVSFLSIFLSSIT